MIISPFWIPTPVIAPPFGNQPSAVPDKSNSVTIPGNVAVSPPARVTLALLQASARDLPSIAWVLVSVSGTAM